MTASASRQQAVGSFGFWLAVPAAVSFFIGWLLHEFVSEKLSIVGMAALVYAVFTLVVMSRNQSKVVRGALLLVNLAVFLAFGYFQGVALLPLTWPSWTRWIGLVLAALLWLSVVISMMYRLGRQAQSNHNRDETPHSTTHATDGGDPALSAQVTERLIAALKLTSSKGDVTVNTGEIIQELAEWSKRTGVEAAAKMSESIMRAVEMKLYGPEDLPFVKKVLRKLQGVPDVPEAHREDNEEDWLDEDEPIRGRSVF